jgi:hypothetical protein
MPGATAVPFQAKLTLESLVDRFDPLADTTEVAIAIGLVLASGRSNRNPFESVSFWNIVPEKPLSANKI